MVISGMAFWVVVLAISYTVTIGTIHLNGKLEKKILDLQNELQSANDMMSMLRERIAKINELEKQNPKIEPAWGTVPSDEPSREDLQANSIRARFTPSMNGVTIKKCIKSATTFADAEGKAHDLFKRRYGNRYIASTLKCTDVKVSQIATYTYAPPSTCVVVFQFSAVVIDE